ncbi:hypothetical protein H2200_010716 [Cladophialophora chaetospira]|uniref:histone acetyltransferase n=1 Tax=Cladophialophora chaetospira TaxID=386627 RepID=A0AA38X0L9_9EURO|nr:hypothetical protein H2200_010716 [Cladophialophora chaetospira]
MSSPPSLQSCLATALPAGLTLQTYHVSTPPTSTPAIFAPQSGTEEETTSCESHFLAVSSPQHGDKKEVFIYAIEVLIFATESLITLFVSKADSSGFSSRLDIPTGSPSVVAAITTTFIEFLLEPRLTSPRVVLSLFARSQNQYLFPGSSDNAGKHILDDRQLIKWWCRVFDRTLRLSRENSTTTAHLVVPGCDQAETKAYFPPSSRGDPPEDQKWINSFPVELMVTDPSLPPRYLIPRLPDDPKARFLDDLDGESVDEGGNWRSVKKLDQFWEFMSYRQECSAGRLVGFLWLILSQDRARHTTLSQLQENNIVQTPVKPQARLPLLTPGNSQQVANGIEDSAPPAPSDLEMLPELNSPPPSSPIETPTCSTSQNDAGEDNATSVSRIAESPTFSKFEQTQGEIIIDGDQYLDLMDYLLQTDFTGKDLAADATRSWIDKVMEFSKATCFGRAVVGCATPILAATSAITNASSAQVNVLTGIRRKRKADVVADGPGGSGVADSAAVAGVNSVSASLIRKKPKS